jgi:hypothetical protein
VAYEFNGDTGVAPQQSAASSTQPKSQQAALANNRLSFV